MFQIYYYKLSENIQKEINSLDYILSDSEKNQASRYRQKKDRLLYCAGKILTKKLISDTFQTDLKKIILKKDKYNRPFLSYPKIKNFDFNISHSQNLLVLAINSSRVGIDVEKIREIDLDIAYNYFHKEESDYLFKCCENKLDKFYQIWTLKESFIKATGEGLLRPLDSFYFKIKSDQIDFVDLREDCSVWNFKIYNTCKGYKMAVCSNDSDWPKPQKINNFKDFILKTP